MHVSKKASQQRDTSHEIPIHLCKYLHRWLTQPDWFGLARQNSFVLAETKLTRSGWHIGGPHDISCWACHTRILLAVPSSSSVLACAVAAKVLAC